MSRSRGHDNVYVLGQDVAVRKLLNSKAAFNVLVVNFFQRRMNTSYNRRVYNHRRGAGGVYLRERWGVTMHRINEYRNFTYPTSTLELYIGDAILAISYPDGSFLGKDSFWSSMQYRLSMKVQQYVDGRYNRVLIAGTNDWLYILKGSPVPVPRPVTPIVVGESFDSIMRREWSVA